MDEKYLEALEFDKIRARAADGIVCPEARGMLLGQPAWETPDEVRAALDEAKDALEDDAAAGANVTVSLV